MSGPAAQPSTDSVTVTTEIAVDPATAFEVFTSEIGDWWWRGKDIGTGRIPRTGRMRFEPGAGGRLLEVYDEARGDAFEIGRVLVWEEASRLVFEWRSGNFEPGQVTEIEVRFEAVAQGTRVTLEHRGLASLPLDHGTRHGLGDSEAFERMMRDWWSEMLSDLRSQAERAGATRSRN